MGKTSLSSHEQRPVPARHPHADLVGRGQPSPAAGDRCADSPREPRLRQYRVGMGNRDQNLVRTIVRADGVRGHSRRGWLRAAARDLGPYRRGRGDSRIIIAIRSTGCSWPRRARSILPWSRTIDCSDSTTFRSYGVDHEPAGSLSPGRAARAGLSAVLRPADRPGGRGQLLQLRELSDPDPRLHLAELSGRLLVRRSPIAPIGSRSSSA